MINTSLEDWAAKENDFVTNRGGQKQDGPQDTTTDGQPRTSHPYNCLRYLEKRNRL